MAADQLWRVACGLPGISLPACWLAACRAEKPVVILSGNSIDHALVAFGALYAGVPFCPVSPAYSLISKDYGKLSYLMQLLMLGLVFADDADKFAARLRPRSPPESKSPWLTVRYAATI